LDTCLQISRRVGRTRLLHWS